MRPRWARACHSSQSQQELQSASSGANLCIEALEKAARIVTDVIEELDEACRLVFAKRSGMALGIWTTRPSMPRCAEGVAYYLSKLAPTLTVIATSTAPNRYERRAWRSAVRRIALSPMFVSDTWNVIPMVNAK